jgi:diketogulonate reductase-like aldo/keto reductase
VGTQAEAHPYFRNDALVEWCRAEGIHFTAYAPLGSPDSASMLSRRSTGPELMAHPVVVEMAQRTGHDVGQVLLRWALQRRPGCSVLPKSVTPSRITSNLTGVRCRERERERGGEDVFLTRGRTHVHSGRKLPEGQTKSR